MKNILKLWFVSTFWIVFFSMTILAQIGCKQNNSDTQQSSVDLVLNIRIDQPYAAVGYGSVYGCKINKVELGSIQDSTISITILAGDNEKDSILSETIMKPVLFEIGFTKHETDEKYSIIPISGFVDQNKTSWKIQYIKPLD